MYKTGLVSISFRANDVTELIGEVKSVELDCIEWGSDVHAPYDDIANLEKIVKLQKEYGIKCSSYGTYFKVGTTPIGELESYIKAAKILGTNVLRIWCGDKDSENYSESEKEKLFEECKKLSEIAEQNGVVLCLECHGWTYTNRLSSALEVMEAVDSNSFKMYWQPNQFRTYEENLEYAEKIAKYTVNIHVFNWDGEDKFPLIEAVDVWREYLKKFSGNENLLLEFMPDGKPESLMTEYEALKEIVGA